MCEVCNKPIHPLPAGSRRRLWDLRDGWHCSILGTCLTMTDLRSIARKLPLKARADFPVDYQLHGFFVQEVAHRNKASQLLTKLLDKRHGGAIRKVRSLKSEQELESFWSTAIKAGDIPGPYWAILSHPDATEKLSERMFADVHMLSHLVGASNRASVRRLTQLENENDAQRNKFSKIQKRHQMRLRIKNKLLSVLQEELAEFRQKYLDVKPPLPQQISMQSSSASTLEHKIEQLQVGKVGSDKRTLQLEEDNARLQRLVKVQQQENETLERALSHKERNIQFDLKGRCLLYVGGRQQTVWRLREHIESQNGKLLHHDGGLEKSINVLANAVGKADAVVFPTDCISHEAALRVKRLCQQSMKPFVPLRTSGLGSLLAGLKNGLGAAPFLENAK